MVFLDRYKLILLDLNGTFIWTRSVRPRREFWRYLPSDHKSMKPSPVVFDMAFRPFGVDKEETVFVGDSWIHDIQGATRFGISAIWINPAGGRAPPADNVVGDLRELTIS